MDDLIRRQDAIDALNKMKIYRPLDSDRYVISDCLNKIVNLPSAQKKGHWNFVGDNLFKCTCCEEMYTTQQLNGLRVYDKDPYCPFFCPHCGADMRGEDDG
jgi:hypothetical protein